MSAAFVDIETQRSDDPMVIRRLQEAVKPPGQYKKAESIAQWYASEGAAARLEAINRTALDGTYGRLATIGYAIGDEEPVILGGPGDTEEHLLVQFKIAMDVEDSVSFVAFNGDFDFRFLMQRYIVHQIPQPLRMRGILARRDGWFDPMREWAGFKGYISQADLERALDVKRNDDIDGSQVGEAIDAGDWERVINHNREDILGLREIYRRMTQ